MHHLDERIKAYDRHIHGMARQDTTAQRLQQLMGIGELSSTAIVAMVGNATEFASGRQFAAWLGLLVMGAKAVLNAAKSGTKTDSLSRWAITVEQRRGYWKAVIAIAAKNARMAWAVLTKGENFKLPA